MLQTFAMLSVPGGKGETLVNRKFWLVTLAVVGLSAGSAGVALAGAVTTAAGNLNVKTVRAQRDGQTHHAAAINKGHTPAQTPRRRLVQVPRGTHKVRATGDLKSHVAPPLGS